MKDDVTSRSQGEQVDATTGTDKVSEKRRKVLKGAGVAAAAGAVWHKPVLDSMVVPAHAQTTDAPMQIVLAGSTGTTGIVMNGLKQEKSVLAKMADAVIPPANAAAVDPVQYICNALTDNMYSGDDYTHCVSITLPEGENPDGAFTLGLEGPDIYYNRIWGCIDDSTRPYYTVYYQGSVNLGGMSAGTLENRCIDVTIGDVAIKGEITEDFTSASGTIAFNSNYPVTGTGSCGNISDGYGAYWSVDLTGGSCSIGSGVDTSNYFVSTDYLSYCDA
jgi:hypothetical protein